MSLPASVAFSVPTTDIDPSLLPARQPDLSAANLTLARYSVQSEGGSWSLHISEECAPLQALLTRARAVSAALLAAYPATNLPAMDGPLAGIAVRELKARLREDGLTILPYVAYDEQTGDALQRGWLALNIGWHLAQNLAAEYGQDHFVWVEAGRTPLLAKSAG